MKTTAQFDPVKLAIYRHSVVNQAPTALSKLLAHTGIEKYRHASIYAEYIREFNEPNHLKG